MPKMLLVRFFPDTVYYANEGCETCASLAGLLVSFIAVVMGVLVVVIVEAEALCCTLRWVCRHKGAITSKIKHAIKHKTSPARLAQLLQPSLSFCFSLQPMTAYHPVLDGTLHWLQAQTKC